MNLRRELKYLDPKHQGKIKVLFISAKPVILAGILSTFSDDPQIRLDILKISSTTTKIENCGYDIIIINDAFPKLEGLLFIKEIIENEDCNFLFHKHTKKIIVYAAKSNATYFKKLINNGINGIVSAYSEISELKKAIINIFEGHEYFCNYIKSILLKEIKLHFTLTAREIEILDYLKEGIGYKNIAFMLNISPSTVNKHIENVKLKLGVKSIKELKRKFDV